MCGGADAGRRWAAAAREPARRSGSPGAGGRRREGAGAREAAREAARAGRVALGTRELAGSWAGALTYADIQATLRRPSSPGDRLLAAAVEETFGGLLDLGSDAQERVRRNLRAALRLEARLAEFQEAVDAEEAAAARAILGGEFLGAWGPPHSTGAG